MANDVKDVMIALHPPSLDRCQRVVDAMYPPAGSDDYICGCTQYGLFVVGLFGGGIAGTNPSPLGDLFNPKSPTFSVEAQDWQK